MTRSVSPTTTSAATTSAPDPRIAFPIAQPHRAVYVGYCLGCLCNHLGSQITSYRDTDGVLGMYCLASGARVKRYPVPFAEFPTTR